MATDNADKVRENLCRRRAKRQGFRLEKNGRRDPQAVDFGSYRIRDDRNRLVTELASLEKVEEWLNATERA